MKSKLIEALTVGIATGFFFVGAVQNAATKEKKETNRYDRDLSVTVLYD